MIGLELVSLEKGVRIRWARACKIFSQLSSYLLITPVPWCYYELLNDRSGVQNSLKAPSVFVRKGIRNLKSCVAPAKSLIRKRACSSRHTLNQQL